VLKLKVPLTVADPDPVAVQVTVQVPLDWVGAVLSGLYTPKTMLVALTKQEKATAARALVRSPTARVAPRSRADAPLMIT